MSKSRTNWLLRLECPHCGGTAHREPAGLWSDIHKKCDTCGIEGFVSVYEEGVDFWPDEDGVCRRQECDECNRECFVEGWS